MAISDDERRAVIAAVVSVLDAGDAVEEFSVERPPAESSPGALESGRVTTVLLKVRRGPAEPEPDEDPPAGPRLAYGNFGVVDWIDDAGGNGD